MWSHSDRAGSWLLLSGQNTHWADARVHYHIINSTNRKKSTTLPRLSHFLCRFLSCDLRFFLHATRRDSRTAKYGTSVRRAPEEVKFVG